MLEVVDLNKAHELELPYEFAKSLYIFSGYNFCTEKTRTNISSRSPHLQFSMRVIDRDADAIKGRFRKR